MDIQIKSVTGNCIKPYIKDLARLRMELFRDFPYLYDGSLEYEEEYLSVYLRSRQTIIVLALDGARVVGASSGMPMSIESEEVKAPFVNTAIPPERVFYFGESLLMKAYRGRGIGHLFFDEREMHAKLLKRFSHTAFCAVVRPDDHPGRPAGYLPLDPFWVKRGYTRRPDLVTSFSWQDLNETQESLKPMVFWIREIS